MNRNELIERYSEPVKVLDHGWIRVIDCMGDDERIEAVARLSYQKGTRKVSETRGLLRYLFSHRHTSPFEQAVISLDMKMPIFVARQLVRHRTQALNELSGRYSELPEEFYVPEPAQVCYQDDKNKQGRSGAFPLIEADQLRGQMRSEAEDAFATYRQYLEAGMSKETARMGLPLSTYTQWCTTMSLHNLLHMLGLRLDKHAQWETRQVANAIWEIVQDWCPITAEAFVDFQLEAETLSRQELAMMRDIVQDWKSMQDDLCESDNRNKNEHMGQILNTMLREYGIENKREQVEMLIKLGLA